MNVSSWRYCSLNPKLNGNSFDISLNSRIILRPCSGNPMWLFAISNMNKGSREFSVSIASSRTTRLESLVSSENSRYSMEYVQHVIHHRRRYARIDPDPECLVHHGIRHLQLTRNSIRLIMVRGLANQVASKKKTRRDLVFFEIAHDGITAEGCSLPDGYGESEPARCTASRGFGHYEELAQIA